MPKHNKRTDKNQAQIVSDLRDAHVQAIVTNFGDDFPDLVTGFGGNWVLIEIKTVDGELSRGQLCFIADARGYIGVACDSTFAIDLATRPDVCAISNSQQNKIAAWLVRNPNQETLSVRKFFDLIAEI